MSTEEKILNTFRRVAMVGLSTKPERPSRKVAAYLKEQGYKIIPVNPGEKEILGEPCYPGLASIPQPVEVVDIFRRPEEVPVLVEEAIRVGAKAVWLQAGIVHNAAAQKAAAAGLKVVQNLCIFQAHRRFFGK